MHRSIYLYRFIQFKITTLLHISIYLYICAYGYRCDIALCACTPTKKHAGSKNVESSKMTAWCVEMVPVIEAHTRWQGDVKCSNDVARAPSSGRTTTAPMTLLRRPRIILTVRYTHAHGGARDPDPAHKSKRTDDRLDALTVTACDVVIVTDRRQSLPLQLSLHHGRLRHSQLLNEVLLLLVALGARRPVRNNHVYNQLIADKVHDRASEQNGRHKKAAKRHRSEKPNHIKIEWPRTAVERKARH